MGDWGAQLILETLLDYIPVLVGYEAQLLITI